MAWNVTNEEVTQEETVEIVSFASGSGGYVLEPPTIMLRPNSYDPDLWWDEALGEWTAVVTGGGNYNQHLVIVNENGDIYFG